MILYRRGSVSTVVAHDTLPLCSVFTVVAHDTLPLCSVFTVVAHDTLPLCSVFTVVAHDTLPSWLGIHRRGSVHFIQGDYVAVIYRQADHLNLALQRILEITDGTTKEMLFGATYRNLFLTEIKKTMMNQISKPAVTLKMCLTTDIDSDTDFY